MLRRDGRRNDPPKRVRFQLPERHWREELELERQAAAAALGDAEDAWSSAALPWGERSPEGERGLPRAGPARGAGRTWLRAVRFRLRALGRSCAVPALRSGKRLLRRPRAPAETLAATGVEEERGERGTVASSPASAQDPLEQSLDAGVPSAEEGQIPSGGDDSGMEQPPAAEEQPPAPRCDEVVDAAVTYISKYVKDLAAYMEEAICQEMELAKELQAFGRSFRKISVPGVSWWGWGAPKLVPQSPAPWVLGSPARCLPGLGPGSSRRPRGACRPSPRSLALRGPSQAGLDGSGQPAEAPALPSPSRRYVLGLARSRSGPPACFLLSQPSGPALETPAPSQQEDVALQEGPRDEERPKQSLEALGQTLLINQQLLEKMEQQWREAERQLQKEKAELCWLPCSEDVGEEGQEEPAEEEEPGARSTARREGWRSWRRELRRCLETQWQLLQQPEGLMLYARWLQITN
ncbi:uncharacterized protein LOC134150292 isoform X1 [Rhea pennata]|uniref:uncharacterized protein LOC134150292 isoform X1 n=1 Tax=Rhea pennata TaxID=8795 RepID=UPI002E263026